MNPSALFAVPLLPAVSRRGRRTAAILVALLLLLLGSAAPAPAVELNVDCRTPRLFSGASLNAVHLQYLYAGGGNRDLSEAARKLSILMHREMLFSIVKYGSIGAVQINVRPNQVSQCSPEAVLARLEEQLQPGHGLVLLWGLLYEQGEDIYVQSYVHFLRRGQLEQLEMRLGEERFVGRLAARSLAFAPRKVSTAELAQVEEQFSRLALVHAEPREGAPSEPLPIGFRDAVSHWVTDVRGEWMKLEPMEDGPRGWVRAGAVLGELSLRQKLPELDYVDALAGYLRLRHAQAGGPPASPAYPRWILRALQRYQAASEPHRAPAAAAVALQMEGMLRAFRPDAQRQDWLQARTRFQQAAALLPYNAGARSMELACNLYFAYQYEPRGIQSKTLARQLLGVAVLEPESEAALSNLQNFYRVLQRAPAEKLDPSDRFEPAELQQQFLKIRALRPAILPREPVPR